MKILRVITLLSLFLLQLSGASSTPFECKKLYIFSNSDQRIDDLEAKVISSSLDIELGGVSYNFLDNFIYALVLDPSHLKGWSRYDIVKLDKDGTILNLGTPAFNGGENVYDAFRVKNGVIDSFGNYYSVGDPISLDSTHSRRAILYSVFLGKDPKAGSLRFRKSELKFSNFDEWQPPRDLVYLNATDKIYCFGGKDLFEIDTKKEAIRKLTIKNSNLLESIEIFNLWGSGQNIFFAYGIDHINRGHIFSLEIDEDEAKIVNEEVVKAYDLINTTNCVAPTLIKESSKSSVEVGGNFFYNFEISNPFPHSIKVDFVSSLPDGVSFDDSFSQELESKNIYFSPSEVRIDGLLIPKYSSIKFNLRVNIEDNFAKTIENRSFIIFRGLKYLAKESEDSNGVKLNAPSLDLIERIIENLDEDKSGDISAGDTLKMEVVASNNGGVTLKDVSVGDPLLSPDSKLCKKVEAGQICRLVGSYKVTIDDEKRGEITTMANASSQNLAPIRNSLKIPVVSNSIDLGVIIGSAKKELIVGNRQRCSINISNLGANMATNIVVKLNLPSNLSLVDGSSEQGDFNPKNGVWTIPFIDSSKRVALLIDLKAQSIGDATFVVEVNSEDKDKNLANNRDSITFKIKAPSPKDILINLAATKKNTKVISDNENSNDDNLTNSGYRNSSPIAKDDEIAVPFGQESFIDLSKGVLSNDKDLDGDPLKVVSFKIDSNGDGIEEEYQPKELVNITGVGEFTILEDGSFKFEPESNSQSSYFPTAIYKVSDGRGGEATAELVLDIGGVAKDEDSVVEGSVLTAEETTTTAEGGIDLGYILIIFTLLLLLAVATIHPPKIDNRRSS